MEDKEKCCCCCGGEVQEKEKLSVVEDAEIRDDDMDFGLIREDYKLLFEYCRDNYQLCIFEILHN